MANHYEQYSVFNDLVSAVERHQKKARELKPKIDKLRRRLKKLEAARGD